MAGKPICPLEWDSTFLQMDFDNHLLADSFGEVINLAHSLCDLIGEGLHHWHAAHYDEDLIPVRPLSALLDNTARPDDPDSVDYPDQWMLGYPDWVKQSATSIFYGLRSAEQHSAGDLAESMRCICHIPARIGSQISNADLYAMAAATTAWWGWDSLKRYLDDILGDLQSDYETNPPGCDGWLRQFKQDCPDDFNRLIAERRAKCIHNEADERDWAARQLGKAKQYLVQAQGTAQIEVISASKAQAEAEVKRGRAEIEIISTSRAQAEAEATRRRAADLAGVDAMNQAKQAPDEFKAKIKSRAIELIRQGGKYRRGNKPNMKQLAAALVEEFPTYQAATGEGRETSENTLRTDWLPDLLKDCCSSR